MKEEHFSVEKDGFYGTYRENSRPSDAALISMIGDDTDDYMAKKIAAWAHRQGLNILSLSPSKKDYSYHNFPLERIKAAADFLKERGNRKTAIAGASTTGMAALAAASYFPEITLTIALTPSDFVWQGFMQGKRDGCHEWPIEGESTLSYRGKPLPYMPFAYKHPDYWHTIEAHTKGSGDFIRSIDIFEESEAAHPLSEDEMIKIENIHGRLILIGAKDDSLWDTARYIRRMAQRLESREHKCSFAAYIYEHGTHFVFPESLIRSMLPFPELMIGFMFRAAKEHPRECTRTRIKIDRVLTSEIRKWLG